MNRVVWECLALTVVWMNFECWKFLVNFEYELIVTGKLSQDLWQQELHKALNYVLRYLQC